MADIKSWRIDGLDGEEYRELSIMVRVSPDEFASLTGDVPSKIRQAIELAQLDELRRTGAWAVPEPKRVA